MTQPTSLYISPVNSTPTFHVSFTIFDRLYYFLVDTGAAATLLNSSTWDKILQSCKPQDAPSLKAVLPRLASVSSSPLSVKGTTTIKLIHNGHTFLTSVIVVDNLSVDAILGLDFLEYHRCSIDIPQRRLALFSDSVPVFIPTITPPNRSTPLCAVLNDTVRIPPYSELETLALVNDFAHESGIWLVEDSLSTSKRLSSTVARAIVTPNHHIVVRLINPANTPATIYKGTRIASLTKLPQTHLQASQVTTTPSLHKQDLLRSIAQNITTISDSEKEQFYSLLLSCSDVFPDDDDDLGHTHFLQHSINTGSAPPIRQPPRRVPKHKQQEARQLIQSMLDRNIIAKSHSPWSSPIILVQKKDGSLRFCVDYRKVNEVTRKDAYPLPRIDETLDTLAGSLWFTTLDLLSGYWQVEVEEKDRDKTAFCTREGLFHFNVMPFGLCNAPATFQRLMDMLLAGLLWESCLVYIDDVIIMGKDVQSHLNNMAAVFSRLRDAGLKVKPSKCEFFKKEVKFLGHIVSNHGISTDPLKTDKIAQWPTPINQQQLQQFLGLASYYRRFVRGFAAICRPLYQLTEKNAPFRWTSECDNAFCELKQLLTSAPVLSYPDFSKPFILDTDASNVGIGAVLSQNHNGMEHVVAYASKSLTKAERNYSVTRRELLAIVTFTNHFRQYLLGREFVLRTDHHSLSWLRNFKNPDGQLARWLERLAEYNFRIEHRAGCKHNNADSLSRYPVQDDIVTAVVSGNDNTPFTLFFYSPADIRHLQLEDNTLSQVLLAKEQQHRPSRDVTSGYGIHTRKLFQMWDQLEVSQGILFRIFQNLDDGSTIRQLVVPFSLRIDILEHMHAGSVGGHLGQSKTLQKIKDRFYWPGHYNDVITWCSTCPSCATRKTLTPKAKAPLNPITVGSPLQLVAVDLLGPLPKSQSGNSYILVAADYFTKWCEAYPLPNMEAVTVANVLTNEMFFRFSPPEWLHSDQGRQFDGCLIKEICRILQIRKSRTSPYHPQCDGLVERFNRTLLNMLATTAKDNPLNWEQYLRPVCFAYNTSTHSSTGFTRFYLMYGREARLPADLDFGVTSPSQGSVSPITYSRQMQLTLNYAYQKVRETLGNVQRRQKLLYDRTLHGKPFNDGDLVWLHSTVVPPHSHRKLHHPWSGPYKIVAKLSDLNYKIAPVQDLSKVSIVHFNRLKPCTQGTRLATPPSLQSPSHSHSTLSQSQYRVGDNITLLDFSEDETSDDDTHGAYVNPPPRHYPTRRRFPPDRGAFISH